MQVQISITGEDFAGYSDLDIKRVRLQAQTMLLWDGIDSESRDIFQQTIDACTTELNRRFSARLDAQQRALPSPPAGAPNLLAEDPEPRPRLKIGDRVLIEQPPFNSVIGTIVEQPGFPNWGIQLAGQNDIKFYRRDELRLLSREAEDPEPWEGHPNTPVSPEELARLIAEDYNR